MITRKCVAALLLAGSGLASTANAATVCVDTAGELVNAVTAYATQPDNTVYTIKVVRGTYLVGPGLNTSGYNNPDRSVGLQILGGYNSDCTQRTINPANTIIDAQDNDHTGLYFIINGNKSATIEGLTLQNFNSSGLSLLKLYHAGEDTANQHLTVRYMRLVDNVAVNGIYVQGEMSRVQNNLVANNTFSGSAVWVNAVEAEDDTNPNITVTNNTVTANSNIGVRLRMASVNMTARASELTNNIIRGNTGTDIVEEVEWLGNGRLSSNGNIYGTQSGDGDLSSTTDLNVDPGFVAPASRNYRITTTSPAYNSGYSYQALGYPALDVSGATRVVGSKIDRGAYENTTNNNTTFIVTTTTDNGNNTSPTPGSLRAAIKAANAATGNYTINFNISGGTCPQTIFLEAPLPDITKNVTIDARTQSGWVGNTQFGAFDANLCVYLYAGGHPYGFRATSNTLSVYGMIFQGFSEAAIVLTGGTGHEFYGNQFGGIFGFRENEYGIKIIQPTTRVKVGNSGDPSNSNWFANGVATAIQIDGQSNGSNGYHTVVGNLIGIDSDGVGAAGNATGVYIYNSAYNLITDNYIGHNSNDGVLIAGPSATRNVVSENHIGASVIDPAIPVGNGGAGVSLTLGAINNTIGANMNASVGGNIIKNNGGAGVRLGYFFSSYATGAKILGNTVDNNGGLAIDLGAEGATPNVATNPIDAPNHGQNYPVLTAATFSEGTFFNLVHFVGNLHGAPAEDYRIDFYWGPVCSGFSDGRGRSTKYLGYIDSVHTDSNGNVAIDTSRGVFGLSSGGVSMTATRMSTGDTSEMGNCLTVTPPITTPELFANGFE